MVLVDLRWLSIFLDGANDLRWVRIILDPVTLFPGAYIGFSLCWGGGGGSGRAMFWYFPFFAPYELPT